MKKRLYHIGSDVHENEFYIEHDSISSKHAQIYIDDNDDLRIIDLASVNGVMVNYNRIDTPVTLKNGDIVTLGEFSFLEKDLKNIIQKKVFDDQSGKSENLSLISSLHTTEGKGSKRKKIKIDKKAIIITLSIIGLIVLGFMTSILINQSQIKSKLQKKEGMIPKNIDKKKEENNESKEKPNIEKVLKKQRTDVTYDFSCLATQGDGGSNRNIYVFGELTRNVQNSVLKDVDVSVEEEKEYGDEIVAEEKKKKEFITSGKDYRRLNRIMKDLISRLANPRGVDYEIHLIDDTIKNVFTLGGHILFYKGMYDFCENDSEIASIIAHEMAHNELGHSTLLLKKRKTVSNFGPFGDILLMMEKVLSASFNQKQEIEADMFGMDLIYPTNYKNCAGVSLWERMGENEGEFNAADNFFRTHPYDRKRSECIQRHINDNYQINCR